MVAFVAGLALATPPVEYLAAMVAILASGAFVAEQLGAALCSPSWRLPSSTSARHLSRFACEDASSGAAAEPLDKRAPPRHPRCHSRRSGSLFVFLAWERSDGLRTRQFGGEFPASSSRSSSDPLRATVS